MDLFCLLSRFADLIAHKHCYFLLYIDTYIPVVSTQKSLRWFCVGSAISNILALVWFAF